MPEPRSRPQRTSGAGARRATGPGLSGLVRHWFRLAGYSLVSSLGRLLRRPLAALMTVGVIAVSLALPAAFYAALVNLDRVSQAWHDAGEATVFMDRQADEARARALAGELEARPDVDTVRVKAPAEALSEFRRLSGFGDALDALEANPLPAVLILRPAERPADSGAARAWVAELEELPDVDFAQFDVTWLMRFNALIALAGRIVAVAGGLFALVVLLVVGNTIRLDIENRREEIEVHKLIGATDRFIRRPFLFTGFWYGTLGGAGAALVVGAILGLLGGPVARLAGTYESEFVLEGLGAAGSLALCAAGALIGLAGAWLAVGRHLARIEPV